mgnify:CR=1 FL=1
MSKKGTALPKIKQKSNFIPMLQEQDEDVDDDGNPLTVAAAQRIFHKDDATKTHYFPKQTYENPKDSLM